jgi:hypothetical protein
VPPRVFRCLGVPDGKRAAGVQTKAGQALWDRSPPGRRIRWMLLALTHRARRPVAIVRAKPATAEVVGRARGAAVVRRQTRSHRDGVHMDEVAAAALREGR